MSEATQAAPPTEAPPAAAAAPEGAEQAAPEAPAPNEGQERYTRLQARYAKLEQDQRRLAKQLKDSEGLQSKLSEYEQLEQQLRDPQKAWQLIQEKYGHRIDDYQIALLKGEADQAPSETDLIKQELEALKTERQKEVEAQQKAQYQAAYRKTVTEVQQALERDERFPYAAALGHAEAITQRFQKHQQEYGEITPEDQARIASEVEQLSARTIERQVSDLLKIGTFRELVQAKLAALDASSSSTETNEPDQQDSRGHQAGKAKKAAPKTLTNTHAATVETRKAGGRTTDAERKARAAQRLADAKRRKRAG